MLIRHTGACVLIRHTGGAFGLDLVPCVLIRHTGGGLQDRITEPELGGAGRHGVNAAPIFADQDTELHERAGGTGGSGQGDTLVGSQGYAGGMTYSPLGTDGSLRMYDTAIVGNEARLAAGLDIGGSGATLPIVLMNLLVADNVATGSGGGIRVSLNGTTAFTLANSVVANNTAAVHSGGIFYLPQNETTLSGQPTGIVNTIIWGNTAPEHPQMRATKGSLPQPVMALDHVLLEGGCLDTNAQQVSCSDVLDADPLFVDAPNGDYHLQTLSPAVDAGDQTLMPADLLDLDGDLVSDMELWPFDFDGAARVSGTEVDLGPYEASP